MCAGYINLFSCAMIIRTMRRHQRSFDHDAHVFFLNNASGSLTRYRGFGAAWWPLGYWWHAFLLGRSGRRAKDDVKATKRLGTREKVPLLIYFSQMPLCSDRTNPISVPIFWGWSRNELTLSSWVRCLFVGKVAHPCRQCCRGQKRPQRIPCFVLGGNIWGPCCCIPVCSHYHIIWCDMMIWCDATVLYYDLIWYDMTQY